MKHVHHAPPRDASRVALPCPPNVCEVEIGPPAGKIHFVTLSRPEAQNLPRATHPEPETHRPRLFVMLDVEEARLSTLIAWSFGSHSADGASRHRLAHVSWHSQNDENEGLETHTPQSDTVVCSECSAEQGNVARRGLLDTNANKDRRELKQERQLTRERMLHSVLAAWSIRSSSWVRARVGTRSIDARDVAAAG